MPGNAEKCRSSAVPRHDLRRDGGPVNCNNRRTIPATCTTHGGTPGFTNLVVSKRDGTIVLDPHAIGSCVITLDEDGAVAVRDVLIDWLG